MINENVNAALCVNNLCNCKYFTHNTS